VKQFGKQVILAALGLGLVAVAGAWSRPTQTPPAGNTPAPINVGGTAQSKLGPLGVGGLGVFGKALVAPAAGYSAPENLQLAVSGSVGASAYCDEQGLNCVTSLGVPAASSSTGIGGASNFRINYGDIVMAGFGGECGGAGSVSRLAGRGPVPAAKVAGGVYVCPDGYIQIAYRQPGCGEGNEASYGICARVGSPNRASKTEAQCAAAAGTVSGTLNDPDISTTPQLRCEIIKPVQETYCSKYWSFGGRQTQWCQERATREVQKLVCPADWIEYEGACI
jgi:hypothetical protein